MATNIKRRFLKMNRATALQNPILNSLSTATIYNARKGTKLKAKAALLSG